MLEFSRPVWLLLLLVLPGIWWLALRMSYASLGPWAKWFSLSLRTLIWLLLVFSIAGAQFVRRSDRVAVIVARDVSDSADQGAYFAVERDLLGARENMKKDDSLGKVSFGRDAYLEHLPLKGISDERLTLWETKPAGNYTNLAAALRLANAAFPDNAQKRLVLVTDANENLGSALAEARVLRDAGVELFVVESGRRSIEEVVLASMEAPSQASLGETVNVRFVLDSNVATPADVTLYANGEFAGRNSVNIRPGKEAYEFPVTIDQSGFYTFELAIEPALDGIPDNNRAYAYSVVGGQPRILYVAGDMNEQSYLPQTIRDHNIAVDVIPPASLPYSMADMLLYDTIVFSDVAAYDITEEQMGMIQSSVRSFGHGFMMLGGEHSFGPGGYFNTPIEETLPVDMDFRRKKVTPSTLVVALIDKSGSMSMQVSGVSKIDMAKEACKEVVNLQQQDDWVAVMGFDSVGQWVVEPTQGINKDATLNKIASMQAGGGTDLYPALQHAYQASKDVPVQIKHFIIFTDGIVAPAPFNTLLAEMVRDNVTVSTVAFGTDADVPFLQDLATLGNGNMYEAKSLYDLPRIFTREVFMANKATLVEEPFLARPTGDHQLTNFISWSGAPTLNGYVATGAKDAAQVPLVTHKDDPLLASWRYGLGKSVAFTSDAKNRWGTNWLNWGGYERFWTGVMRWLRSDLDSGGLSVTTSTIGNTGIVQVSALDEAGNYINQADITALIVNPELEEVELNLKQVGPGEYSAEFPLDQNGNYFVSTALFDGEGAERNAVAAQAGGLAVSYSPEYRNLDANSFLMSQLISTSIAEPEVSLAGLFTEARKPTKRLEDAWELFTLLALCLWLFDVASRRLALDFKEFGLLVTGLLSGQSFGRAQRTAESLAGLLAVKTRFQDSGRLRVDEQDKSAVAKVDKQQAAARRERLDAEVAARERASGQQLGEAPSQSGGKISAEKRPGRGAEVSSTLSSLRKKMADGDQPTRQVSTEQKFGTKDSKPASKPPPDAAQKPEELSRSEFTDRLRKSRDKWKR